MCTKNLAAFLLVLNFFLFNCLQINCYSCKSVAGADVDWFYVYKLPTLGSAKDGSLLVNGTAFLYADSKSNGWIQSIEGIDSPKSAIGLTLQQLFKAKNKKSHFYALYNDENPLDNKTDTNRAHMKGGLIFDDISGLWLIHSVPLFPNSAKTEYTYPDSGKRNGQSFLCITFSSAILDDIGKYLFVSQPSIYEQNFPTSYEHLYPNLDKVIKKKPFRKSPITTILSLKSLKGTDFTGFSKHKKFAKDLYEDFVAQQLKTSLFVETWLNGPNDMLSNCTSNFSVYNLRSVKPFKYSFNNSKDHSKWAVGIDASDPWICIGDINRQISQRKRGGGTVCLNNANISMLYRLSVDRIECCSIKTKNQNPNFAERCVTSSFN